VELEWGVILSRESKTRGHRNPIDRPLRPSHQKTTRTGRTTTTTTTPAWLAKPTPSPAANAATPFNAYAPGSSFNSRRQALGSSAAAGLTTAAAPVASPPGRPAPAPGGRPGPALLWLRADLRLHDHPALKAASAGGRAVLPVLVLDERDYRAGAGVKQQQQQQPHHPAHPRRAATTPPPPTTARFGPARAAFTLAAAADLRARLRAAGSDLVVRTGAPEEVLPALARAVRATEVFASAEVARPDVAAEDAVSAALGGSGGGGNGGHGAARLVLVGEGGAQLFEPADLAKAGGGGGRGRALPSSFGEFKRAVAGLRVRPPTPPPARAPPLPRAPVPPGDLPTVEQLTGVKQADSPSGFQGGEGPGLARLASLGGGGSATSSKGPAGAAAALAALGPWLAAGCLSARRVLADLTSGGGFDGSEEGNPVWDHLAFRDFWRLAAGAGARDRAGVAGVAAPA
jgi:deoxyribodipyrimidine photolyase